MHGMGDAMERELTRLHRVTRVTAQTQYDRS